jgi:hypothetical protein
MAPSFLETKRPRRAEVAAATPILGAALLAVVAINVALWLIAPGGIYENTLHHAWSVFTGPHGDDSWQPMARALAYLQSAQAKPLYSELFFQQGLRFQYPPSALFALMGLLLGGPARVLVNDEAYTGPWPTINAMVGWVFLAAFTAAVAATLENRLRQHEAAADRRRVLLRAFIVVGLTLTFYPLVKSFTLGQIQLWINALLALALFAWVTGRATAAGLLVGLVCLIKPHYGLILVWAALRGEWRLMLAVAITLAAGLIASIAVFGWANHVDYLRVLLYLSERGESYYPNQSVNGVLNRLMSIGDPHAYNNVYWREGHFPPFTPLVYAGTLASSLAILALAVFRRRRAGDPGRVFDFAAVVLACTMASPIAWEHHYGVTLAVFAILFADAVSGTAATRSTDAPARTRRLGWLAASYLLIVVFIPAANLLAASALNLVQSHLFAGAVILLVLLNLRPLAARAAARVERAPAEASAFATPARAEATHPA